MYNFKDLARDKRWKELERCLQIWRSQQDGDDDTLLTSSQIDSALSYACRYNAPLKTVKEIFKSNCEKFGIKIASTFGKNQISGTALHEAMAKSSISVIDFLVNVAANEVFLVQDVDGQVPLHILVRRVFTSQPAEHPALLRVMEVTISKNPCACVIADRNLYEENPLVLALKAHFYYDFGHHTISRCDQREMLETVTHKVASLILKAYPKIASTMSPRGYTPLHSAIYHGRSLPLVKDIMNQFKGSCLIRNGLGEVPLHFAAMRFDSVETFESLLQLVPQSARCQDALNLTPLHWTFIRYLTLSDFQQLQRQQRPLDYTGFRFLPHDYLNLVKQFDDAVNKLCKDNCKIAITDTGLNQMKGDFVGFWNRMKAILLAIYDVDDKLLARNEVWEGDIYLLHSSCIVPCPTSIPYMLNKYDQNAVRRRDVLGRIPLHYACERNNNTWSIKVGRTESLQQIHIHENTSTLVSFLVSNFKEGTRISDMNSQLPLHRALDSQCINADVINILVSSFPASVNMRDGVTKLYPFMLAASSKMNRSKPIVLNNHEGKMKHDGVLSEFQSKNELDVVFNLLKLNPDLVNIMEESAILSHVTKKQRM